MRTRWIHALLFLGLAAGAHLVHRVAGAEEEGLERLDPLPNARILRFLTTSHHTSAADLYWLKLVQHVGTEAALEAGWPGLEALAELVTTLDPKYGYAYQSAGVLLSTVNRIESSNEILGRGMENVPDRWQLPFYAAFNRWHHEGKFKEAGELMLRAARIPGRPAYVPDLASRLYASSGSLEDGIGLLELMIENTEDPLLRDELSRRREDLVIEKMLRRIEDRVAEALAQAGRYPPTLQLLGDPAIDAFLASPLGKTIRWDPKTGEVRSLYLKDRLVVYDPDAPPESAAEEVEAAPPTSATPAGRLIPTDESSEESR